MKSFGKVFILVSLFTGLQAYAASLTVLNQSGKELTAAITHVQCRLAAQVKGFEFNTDKAKEVYDSLKSSGENPCDVKTIANGQSIILTGKGLWIRGFSLHLKDKDGRALFGGKIKDVKVGTTVTVSPSMVSYTDKKSNARTLSK